MTTTTPLTLSELADIGSKAACVQLGLEQDDSQTLIVHPCPGYERDAPAREAFTKAILDAIGYKLLVDFEREAYDKWASQEGPIAGLFEAFKAGRAMLRESMEKQCHSALDEIIPQTAKQPEKSDIKDYIFHYQSDRDLAKGVPLEAQQPENDGWIPWSGGECPVSGTTTVSLRFRNGSEGNDIDTPLSWDWTHNVIKPTQTDIIAYKIIPQTTTK